MFIGAVLRRRHMQTSFGVGAVVPCGETVPRTIPWVVSASYVPGLCWIYELYIFEVGKVVMSRYDEVPESTHGFAILRETLDVEWLIRPNE